MATHVDERVTHVEWFLRGVLTGVAGTCIVIAIITVTIIGNVR